MIWGIAAVMALFVVLLFAWPRSVKADADGPDPDPLGPVRAQLAELEADYGSNKLDTAAYQSAKLELERRLLRLDKAVRSKPALKADSGRWSGLLVGILVSSLAVLVYLETGRPNQPEALGARVTLGSMPLTDGGPTLAEARAIIEERLKVSPDDIEALGMHLRTVMALADFGAAGNTAQRLIALEPENASWYQAALEAYLRAAGGQMTAGTRLLLQDFRAAHPGHPFAEFQTARLLAVDGDKEGALITLKALAEQSDPAAPWMADVNRVIASLGPPAVIERQEEAPQPLRGPTSADIEAAGQMSAEDRATFIASMVARLAARLEETPNDPAGWERLARSRIALDGRAAGEAVLDTAKAKNPENSDHYQALLDRLRQTGEL